MTVQRVLIVDDNRDAALAIKYLLELCGHQVAVAYDGESGIEQAAAFAPDVLLCDIGLPGNSDGYEVAETLRQRPECSEAHMIAITGYGRAEDVRRALEAGFDLHLTKPVDAMALNELIVNGRKPTPN